MKLLYLAIFLVVLVYGFYLIVSHMSKKGIKDKMDSDNILNLFEPYNSAPKLTQMIEFHKNNGIVEYDIGETGDI